MNALAALTLVLLGGASPETTVQEGDSLAQVAKRTLGDERAVPELKALNALTTDKVAAGTTLKLPGSDRALALSALSAARTAVDQAGPVARNRAEAGTKLELAETLFKSARYSEAAKAADAVWQLVSTSAGQPTRFAVEVADSGRTTVTARSGQPVRVEAQGVTEAVYAGHSVNVEKGQSPQGEGTEPAAEPPPNAPAPVSPLDAAQLRFKPTAKGLGPIRVAWTPVSGASSYEVELFPAGDAKPIVLVASRNEARLPLLAAGRYRWAVRAVNGSGVRSVPSAERTFELTDEELKLDVKTNTWK
jgi:LysM repeat protein